VNCWVIPAGIVELAGETEIATNTGCITTRLADPEIEPDVAVTSLVPVPTPVANPPLL